MRRAPQVVAHRKEPRFSVGLAPFETRRIISQMHEGPAMTLRYIYDLILVLTQKEMKVRYKSSFFGYLWSVGHPLAFAFVFFVAFKVVMRIPMENYTLFLIAGLFPWQWFANSVSISTYAFLANPSIIKKVQFPRGALVAAVVLQDMIHFILAIPVIVFFMLLDGKAPAVLWLPGVPLLLFVQFLFTCGLSLFVASVNLFFRDMERLTVIFTTLLFYFTPIIYPMSMVPERYRHFLNYNPVTPIIVSWRDLFLEGRIEPGSLLLGFLYAVASFAAGYAVYRRLSWKFAEVL